MAADIIIYWLGRADYLGCVDGQWFAWPAQAGGWARRRKAREDEAEPSDELPPDLARLAILASGVSGVNV
jgi:hypothetical protein